jgi:nucleotide-binding universal stress UspA family protein
MRKILVATDYSESAENAIRYGVNLANQFGSQLTLMSAIDKPYAGSEAGMLLDAEGDAHHQINQMMARLRDGIQSKMRNGARVDMRTIDGVPGTVIPRLAKRHDYELIVMGTTGSTAAREIFTGSVANATIKNSELPVLAVPARASYTPIRRVLLSVGRDKIDGERVLLPLIKLLRAYDAELIIYHADTDGEGKGYDPSLTRHLEGIRHRFVVHPASRGELAGGIKQAMDEQGADLLCMIYRDRGFFGRLFNQSTVSKVVFDSEVPLLVLQDD